VPKSFKARITQIIMLISAEKKGRRASHLNLNCRASKLAGTAPTPTKIHVIDKMRSIAVRSGSP
jgi:hypothetical protein